MSKLDLIMMSTSTSSSVPINGIIPLTTINRRRGCSAINTIANNVVLTKAGYYSVKGTITFTAPVAGNATIQLYKNGTPVDGIIASETITTATTEVRTMPISGIVRVFSNESTATFNLVVSGIAITVSNAELDFIYEE